MISKGTDLVCVVARVQIWEDAHICLASHLTVFLDFLLCDLRVHSCIILDWTCSASLPQLRPSFASQPESVPDVYVLHFRMTHMHHATVAVLEAGSNDKTGNVCEMHHAM